MPCITPGAPALKSLWQPYQKSENIVKFHSYKYKMFDVNFTILSKVIIHTLQVRRISFSVDNAVHKLGACLE